MKLKTFSPKKSNNRKVKKKEEDQKDKGRALTLKKFTKDGSSGGSVTVEGGAEGSNGPSITDIVGTASSSSKPLGRKINKR